VPAKSET
jgi:hypothetical protein